MTFKFLHRSIDFDIAYIAGLRAAFRIRRFQMPTCIGVEVNVRTAVVTINPSPLPARNSLGRSSSGQATTVCAASRCDCIYTLEFTSCG